MKTPIEIDLHQISTAEFRLGDDHNIAVAKLVQHLVQLRSHALRPADLVRKNLFSPGSRKGVRLWPYQMVCALNYSKVELLANLLIFPTLWRT